MMGNLLAALALIVVCTVCQTEARTMNSSNRIDTLFFKTKPVCFGRFVMVVPEDAEVIFGLQAFGPTIRTTKDGASDAHKRYLQMENSLKTKKLQDGVTPWLQSTDSTKNGNAYALTWWDGDSGQRAKLDELTAFIKSGPHLFDYHDSTGNLSKEEMLDDFKYISTNLRDRLNNEVPTEPGVCLDLGFIRDNSGKFQEIFNIGLRFPSLPDVSFSISTNKDARRDSSFEERRSEARKAALLYAPLATLFSKVKTLREGKHKVYRWQGDEALFRHPLDEGTGVWHEFQFEYAGIRYDHRNPGWDAALFSGVKENEAGAQAASLSDEEAIELWDRLLSTLRLRVPE